jgi:hypothetical protein
MTKDRKEYDPPNIQECHYLILQVINQAIKDYEHYRNKTREDDKAIFESARAFLFDDDYCFDWGDHQVNLDYLCSLIDIEIGWLRNKIVEKLEVQMLPDGRIVPKRRY